MPLYLPPAIEVSAGIGESYAFRDESVLGTRLNLLFVTDSMAAARAAAMTVRFTIDRLNLILNSRDPHSELSQLNRAREHRASPELFAVVAAAEQWRTITSGAYSGRLGRVLDAWAAATDDVFSRPLPSSGQTSRIQATDHQELRVLLADSARAAEEAHVTLDAGSLTIVRPAAVHFALDGLAKGWIVDQAFAAAMATARIAGALVDIGGDVRCGGTPPAPHGWCIGVPDPNRPFDNAPLVATAHVANHAVATSGRGPRDRHIGGVAYSATVSPKDGWPVDHRRSATVIATTAVAADALATAALVLPERDALSLLESHGTAARVSHGEVAWTKTALDTSSRAHFTAASLSTPEPETTQRTLWSEGWQALATFTAPRRQLIRDPSFRSPYVAMWITDTANNPVRTLLLVGKRPDWQKDNFIWWSINRSSTEKLVATRSMSTSAAGVYNVFWDGVDDHGRAMPLGEYVLHVETSRERGQHTYRSLPLTIDAPKRFVKALPPSEEGGGLRISFDRY